uniref:SUMO interacting motifs containing 1 n=1 Tax=Fundulus heteroclitus TaxID=8078 RepID=A0A147B6U7_FUNHE
MDEVICLSSDDSDLEIVGSYDAFARSEPPPPLSEVRVDVDAVNVNIPRHYIDLTDPRWACPELKVHLRLKLPDIPAADATATGDKETAPETKGCLPNGDRRFDGILSMSNVLNEQGFKRPEKTSGVSRASPPQQDCGPQCAKKRRLSSPPPAQKQNLATPPSQDAAEERPDGSASPGSRAESPTARVQPSKDSPRTPLAFKRSHNSEAERCSTGLEAAPSSLNLSRLKCAEPATAGNETPQEQTKELLRDEATQRLQIPADCPKATEGHDDDATSGQRRTTQNEPDGFHSSDVSPSPASTSSSPDKTQEEDVRSSSEQLDAENAEPAPPCLSDAPSRRSPRSLKADSDSLASFPPLNHTSPGGESPGPDHAPGDSPSDWHLETASYSEEAGADSLTWLPWQGEADGEDRLCRDFRAVSREERRYVCPVALKKLMAGHRRVLIDRDDENPKACEVLCPQSLSQVYSTIEENYPEATLQQLSDLLQPGYYPPKDITSHLLQGILLDPHCPYHLCVQAFNLLMRTQRHHRANRSLVPWDWELLSSVLSNHLEHSSEQNGGKPKHRWEVVHMFLEYCMQTLEDDFIARSASLSLSHSLAKASLSCDRQFSRVRDVIKWLFCVIMKTTENEDSKEGIKMKDNQIRIVSVFQRMLSLALEVDRSPTLTSAKLSQELFHMVLSHMPLRAHRMLLLETLQSKLLRCKLLEQLLDYACPQKVSLPMSLSLLLHFLRTCTLAADPTDGLERWQRWEELINLLWMLLVSYSKAMKGHLTSSTSEQICKGGTLVYKPADMLTKSAVNEAMDAFLSRSQADIGRALPLHVEESLTYLQDHLLDVCQS